MDRWPFSKFFFQMLFWKIMNSPNWSFPQFETGCKTKRELVWLFISRAPRHLSGWHFSSGVIYDSSRRWKEARPILRAKLWGSGLGVVWIKWSWGLWGWGLFSPVKSGSDTQLKLSAALSTKKSKGDNWGPRFFKQRRESVTCSDHHKWRYSEAPATAISGAFKALPLRDAKKAYWQSATSRNSHESATKFRCYKKVVPRQVPRLNKPSLAWYVGIETKWS